MEHTFDIEVAKEYGMLGAVIIRNFQYWITKNKANNTHLIDGHYWTYNSYDALCELFPYASKDQIKRQIAKLEESGVLLRGHFADDPRDRTTWFAFVDEDRWCDFTRCMERNRTIDSAKSHDVLYTDNKHTDNKPNILKENIKENFSLSDDFVSVVELWLTYKKERKQSYKSDTSVSTMVKHLIEYSKGDASVARQIVEQSIANNYSGLFPLKSNGKDTQQSSSPEIDYTLSAMQRRLQHPQ